MVFRSRWMQNMDELVKNLKKILKTSFLKLYFNFTSTMYNKQKKVAQSWVKEVYSVNFLSLVIR